MYFAAKCIAFRAITLVYKCSIFCMVSDYILIFSNTSSVNSALNFLLNLHKGRENFNPKKEQYYKDVFFNI